MLKQRVQRERFGKRSGRKHPRRCGSDVAEFVIDAMGDHLQPTKQFCQSLTNLFGLAIRGNAALAYFRFFSTIDVPPSLQEGLGLIDKAPAGVEVAPRPLQQVTD